MTKAENYRILDQEEVAPQHFRMKIKAPIIAAQAQAGQFVHVLPRSASICDPLLRRAFSILKADDGAIDILYRVEGRGTSLLSSLKAGDSINLLGPLGQNFEPLYNSSLLVGGGVGVPPMAMLASTRNESQDTRAIIGARTKADLICLEDFGNYGVPVDIATDDGSRGYKGRVTDLLEMQLRARSDTKPRVYACGPLPMLRAVAKLCREYSVEAQVSLEENLPCGVGVCNGCVVPIVTAERDYDRFRRICIQGPVMWASEVDWEQYESAC